VSENDGDDLSQTDGEKNEHAYHDDENESDEI
jgi:hypothetical protein